MTGRTLPNPAAVSTAVRSEGLYRSIFEDAAEGILLSTPDGFLLAANPAAARMLGYGSPDELVSSGTNPGRRFHADARDREALRQRLERFGEVRGYETRGLRKDGTPLWVSLSARLVRDESTGTSQVLTMIADISERRRADEVRASLAAIIESSNDAIIGRSLDGTITSWNAGAERMLGYSAGEAIGRPVSFMLPPGQHVRTAEINEKVLRGEAIAPHETRRVSRDGREIVVLSSVSPIRDADGRITGASHILRDITAVKRAEETLRAMFDQAGVGIGLRSLDPRNPRWLRVNQKLCDIFGYSEQELLQLTTVDLTPPAERGLAIDYNEKLRTGEIASYSREKRYLRKDGRIIWANVSLAALRSAEGRPTHVISVVEDITDRKEAEEKLRRMSRMRAVLSDINAAIVRVQGRKALFDETCRIAVEQAQLGSAWIGVLDPATLDITPVAWAGDGSSEMYAAKATVRDDPPRGQGAVSRAVRERRVVINNDLSRKGFGGPRLEAVLKLGFRSMIALPLFDGAAVAGTLALYAREADFFDEEETALLTELAGNISFALEHLSRQEKIEKLSRIRAVSSEINATIVRVREQQALLEEIFRIASGLGGFPMVWIGAIDAERQEVRPVAWTGFSAESARAVSWASISGAKGTLGEAMRTCKAAVRNDIETQLPAGKLRQEALAHGCLSTICLPLMVENKVTALAALFAPGRGFFDEDELALLNEVAGNISFALEHIARQDRIEKLSRVRAVSSEINAAIARVRDRETLLRETCRVATEHGKFEFVWVASVDQGKQLIQPVAWAGFDPATAQGVRWASLNAPGVTLAEVMRTKRLAVRNDIEHEQPTGILRGEAAKKGCRSTVCLPFVVDEEVVAAMILFAAGANFFVDDELALLNEIAGDISFALQNIEKREKLDYLSYYDPLTGLPNRSLFVDRTGQQMRSRGGELTMTALVLLNLDRFRNINETLGRHGGDELLRLVARRLEAAFSGKDYLARTGADVFGIVIRGMRDSQAVVHAIENQVLGCFREPFEVAGAELRVAARAGIALHPADGSDADTLFNNAEAALKKARDSGEHYLFYAADMNARAAQMVSLETRLRRAVEAEQFVLHYQPKFRLTSDSLCGFEALIRWNDPESGLVAPGTFIPLLEETGLILEIGKWALARALADHRRWAASGCAVPRVAVNVSSVQLHRRDFTETVVGIVQEAGGAPDTLELEITESLLMKDVKASIAKLSILRQLGVRVAMDDFGTGYSSLSYIAQLPIDSVKIDRSFINGMAGSPQDMSIVTTIITLAHSLNLRVVAEGVETREQAQLLRLLKCDEAQGFLFSRPLPAAEIASLLRAPR